MVPFVENFPFFSIFLPIICGVFCLLLGSRATKWITFAALSTVIVMSAFLLEYTLRTGVSFSYMMGKFPAPFGNELRAGAFEAFKALLFSTVSLLSLMGGYRDILLDIPQKKINLHFLMMNLLVAAMLAVIYTNDIFTAYVFIEIIVITACAIICTKPGGRTMMATMSYLIMSLVGSGMVLLGIAMLYGVTGHLLFPGLKAGISGIAVAGEYTVPLFVLGSLFVAGFSIKSALFPFHGWLPDAHASATTASSAVLSGLIVKTYIILLIRMAYNVFGLERMDLLGIPNILVVFALSGIIFASWKAIRQRNIKLMLSYASITSIGFIYAAISLNTNEGITAASFHITAHALAKAMLFTAAGGLAAVSGGRKDYDSLVGAARRDPLTGMAFVLGGLCMIGIPPFSGFFSKLYLATSAMDTPAAAYIILIAIILSTVMSTAYYFPVIIRILSRSAAPELPPDLQQQPILSSYRAAILVFMSLNILLSLFSQPIIRVIEQGLAALG